MARDHHRAITNRLYGGDHDMRVRQEAQFELAGRKTDAVDSVLSKVAHLSKNRIARLHAMFFSGAALSPYIWNSLDELAVQETGTIMYDVPSSFQRRNVAPSAPTS